MRESTTVPVSAATIETSGTTSGPLAKVATSRRPLGLVVPILVLLVYWTITECSYRLEMGMFYRFVTRMVALLVTILFFVGWGFTRRHFSLGQRWLAFVMIMGTMFLAGAISDQTAGVPMMVMVGLPIVLSLSVAWLWGTRQRSVRLELSGIGVVSVAVFGVISLLRWDGMEGRQRPEYSWRWSPNAEQRFLLQATEQVRQRVVPAAADTRPVLEENASDWSCFRGGDRESVVRGVELSDWSQTSPREVWRRRVGPGWSSMIAIGKLLFTQEQRGDYEAVVCYLAGTGDEVWVHRPTEAKERFDNALSGAGPRATPTFHDNRIYAYGANGRLDCLDAVTGQVHWTKPLFAMTGAKVPQWGSATSPVIVDDKVVVFTGGPADNSLLALDCLAGELRWQAAGGAVSYSSPQVMTIAGQRQIVMHDEAGLQGVRMEDGKPLWRHLSPHSGSFQPMIQPHQIAADRLLVNWDSGLLCLQVHCAGDTWRVEEVWTSNRLKPAFNDFVIHGEHIYGLDDGILCCVDLAKQQRVWKRGRYGFGQMLLLPDVNELLVLSEQGDVVRVAADPKEHREIGRFKAIEGKTWNHPILVHGRLIVRNSEEMACFEVARQTVD